MPKGRVPDREYFFNILNTFQPQYVDQIIRHANDQRNSISNEAQARETIEVSDNWWNALNATPFISREYFFFYLNKLILFNTMCRVKGKNNSPAETELKACASIAEETQD